MITALAAITIAAALVWAAAIYERMSNPRVRHARYISMPRWQLRARGEHRTSPAEILDRITAADWPPPAVAHG